jgi:hypothetical protein
MSTVVNPTRSSLFVSAALLAIFGASVVPIAAAQGTPAAAPPAEPAASSTVAASAPEETAAQPPAADLAADLAALRAEVNALKVKQDEAETAALLSQSSESAGDVVEPEMIHIYGFMDFGLDKYFMKPADGLNILRPTPATTFVFGNLNLYFDANPVEHLRTMVELRFTMAPHGEETQLGPPLGTSYQRIDTTAFDYSSPSSQSQLRLGGVFIERAWSEYQFSDLFKVQAGLFLNPFGIWNLDHGSPTLIALMLPTFIASQMVPTRLLGVHVHGSAFSGSNEFGYALHLTNGRTPLDFDLTEDKALGARLYWAHEGDFGRLVLGTSGYAGSYVDQQKVVTPAGPGIVDFVDTVHYNEQLLGLDAALDVGDLRVRSEMVFRWVEYKDGKSERIFTPDGSEQYLASRLEYAGYVMAAYRTPWRLEPYVEAEVSSKSYILPRWAGDSRASTANTAALALSGGLNVELTSHTLLKGQLVWDTGYDKGFTHKTVDTWILFLRLVDSF